MTSSGELHQLQTVDGSRVRYRRWLPDGDVRGTVQWCTGPGALRALRAAGAGPHRARLRGLGDGPPRSRPDGGEHGIGRYGGGLGVDTVLDDVDALHLVIDDEHPGVPRVLLGHSMGSISRWPAPSGTVPTSPAWSSPGRSGWRRSLADSVTALEEAVAAGAADHALDALGAFNENFEPARTRYDWLSRDPAEVDKYVADPLSGDEMP